MDVFTMMQKEEEPQYRAANIVDLDPGSNEAAEVQEIIQEISEKQIPVHLILQSPSIEFRAILMAKGDRIWVEKPDYMASHVNFGSVLYLDWVEKEEKEHHVLTLTVVHPHAQNDDLHSGMLCEISASYRHISFQDRLWERFDVSKRYDCRLKIPGKLTWFRVLDISPEGLRFEVLPNQRHLFNPEQRYHHFQLEIGDLKIENDINVRDLHGSSVSCRIGVAKNNYRQMETLIKSLEQ
ncbi:MAG: PilZ domain-containing protein [SAR324 cluster bacterium]|nr:PilZ domain-containing protein [SAR324 cluster bacterium]